MASRREALGIVPCGAVMVGNPEFWDRRVNEILDLLTPTYPCPIFIYVDFSKVATGSSYAWEAVENGEARRVCVQWTTQPREVTKRLLYNICWSDELGVGHVEHATRRICTALMTQVLRKTNTMAEPVQKAWHKRILVPADGWCGWHALVASHDLSKFEKIPRHNGVPVNFIVAKDELKVVKEFHAATCARALELCDPCFFPEIQRVQSQQAYAPADLRWISTALGITIRVTCSAQAGLVKSGYIYILHYINYIIYIYKVPCTHK